MAIRDIINRIRFGPKTPTALEQQRSMSIAGSTFTRATGAGLTLPGVSPKASQLVRNIVPGVASALPGGQTGRLRGLVSGARGVYERALGNPLGAGGFKGFLGRVTGRTIGGASIAVGAGLTESAITGKPLDITPRRLAFGALGFGIGGPVGALAGTAFGGISKAGEAIKGGIEKGIDILPTLPKMPSPYEAGAGLADVLQSLGAGASQFGSGLIGGPSAIYGPSMSFSPSGSVGGMDNSLLLLALLGGGLGGFLLGRKKRKKKKSKKAKRYSK